MIRSGKEFAPEEFWREISVRATSRGVSSVRFGPSAAPEDTDDEPLAVEARAQLRAYLNGERQVFDLPLDLGGVTPFRQSVFQKLLAIPFGETATYGEIATRVGCRSPRAVGQAVGSNPLPILVPCHRVVAGNGRLGGFSAGLDRKVVLLSVEGIRADAPDFSATIAPAPSRD